MEEEKKVENITTNNTGVSRDISKEQVKVKDIINNPKYRRLATIGVGIALLIALVFFGWNLFTGGSDAQKSGKVADISKEAQEAYRKGDFATVEKKLGEALEIFPEDPRVLATIIKAVSNQGNVAGTESDAFQRAKVYIDKALSTNPMDKEVLMSVGYAYETSGQYEKALEYYEEALVYAPNDPQALFHKGHVLEFLGQQEEAFVEYKKAYSINAQVADITMAYAKVLLLSGDREGALEAYLSVESLENTNAKLTAEALTNAAIISRVDFADLPSSLLYSTKAVQLADDFSPALAEHGFNLAMDNRIGEGIEYMKQSIIANPRISQNYWRLGGLYRLNGDFTSALESQNQALARVPNDNTILNEENRKIIKAAIEYDLATTNLRLGNNSSVLPLLQQAIADNPELKRQLKTDFEEYSVFESLNQNAEIEKLIL